MAKTIGRRQQKEEEYEDVAPDMAPADSDDNDSTIEEGSDDVDDDEEYDSAIDEEESNSVADVDPQVSDGYDDDDDDDDDDEEGDEFEEQGSSSDEDDDEKGDDDEYEDDEVEILDDLDDLDIDSAPRSWPKTSTEKKRSASGKGIAPSSSPTNGSAANEARMTTVTNGDDEDPAVIAQWMHADDLSSDDEDDGGVHNRIGRVPLHWYDDYEHIGYDAHGKKVIKSKSSSNGGIDLLDAALAAQDTLEDGTNKFTVYDALNARDVTLTPRQIELVRRLQSGAFAHPEHDANPDYIDYFSGVDPIKSGLNSNRYENKARFQPSKWEKLQVRRLLHRLKCGSINMDYLEGKVRDMNDLVKRGDGEQNTDMPFALWKGDEEDELALRKGPQHMPAPKVPPPGHAYSYNPPEEYLPTEDELKEWEELDPIDRPYGLFIPRKFTNLRSVGAYEHSVRERFERCLDLYLCPRAAKRRLNIDPESLVPQLPRASDLRPFPTTKCIRYIVPGLEKDDEEEEGAVPVRCLSASPDGQFLVSGDENGIVRLWEVQTGRLLRSWDLNDVVSVGSVGGFDDKMGDMKNESKVRLLLFICVNVC
jgi:ribosome biogenesis protein ERB1